VPTDERTDGDPTDRGLLAHRLTVTALAVVIAWRLIDVVPRLSLVPRDFGRWFEATWLNPIFGLYAGALALLIVWRAEDRRGAKALGLFLASYGVCLALSTNPSGTASPETRIAFATFWTATILLSWRFWSRFPRTITADEVQAPARGPSYSRWLRALNRLSATVVGRILRMRATAFVFAVLAAVFGWTLGTVGTYEYTFFIRDRGFLSAAHAVALSLSSVISIAVALAFAWTAYRLADAKGRSHIRWIVIAQVVIGFWTAMAISLLWLADVTGSTPLALAERFFGRTFHVVTSAANLTGFALAVFYSGALDLRPVINRTTVYGAMLVLLSFVFAGVEELLQSHLAEQLGVPDGLGTWVGAAVVALAMGPIHTRLQTFVRNLGSELERS